MSRYLFGLSVIINTLMLFILIQSGREFLKRVPFDMQDVRRDYRNNARALLMRACIEGTDYPPEFRKNNSGWNENSPPGYCDRVREHLEEWVESSSKTLGTGMEQ